MVRNAEKLTMNSNNDVIQIALLRTHAPTIMADKKMSRTSDGMSITLTLVDL